jgi:hypothetical protein
MSYIKFTLKGYILIFFLSVVFPVLSTAQEVATAAPAKAKWSFLVEPYLLFPNMNGKTGVGGLPDVPVDANPGDIFSHLQMGAMLNLEANNDKWAILSDFIYMDLSQDAKVGTVIKGGEATAKQTAWEISGLRRVAPWLELGLGGIFNSVNAGVDIDVAKTGGGTTNHQKSISSSWVEPMLIARIKNKPGEKFLYQFRGEVGGFGIGSDFAWQIQASAGYRFSELFQITGGYRAIGLNYETGSDQSRFLYDMDIFGPEIRFGFNF